MRDVLEHLAESLENNRPAILGAIVRSSGSAPRTSGARMLVEHDGTLIGSVGGGELEGACQARVEEMFECSEHYARLDFPIGLTIGADTPQEIAISIVGELIRTRAGAGQ